MGVGCVFLINKSVYHEVQVQREDRYAEKIHFYSSNGFNKTQGIFYISDSLAGDVTRSEARFTELYNQLGKLSVVIQ